MSQRKPLSLTTKLGSTMVVVVVAALAMATTLNLLRLEDAYKRLVAQRLDVTAQEIGHAVGVGLDIGLQLKAQGNLPDLLRQQIVTHPDITNIVIHDCTGHVVVGNASPNDHPWLANLGKPEWKVFSSKQVGVGVMVRDNLGKCAAGVAVETNARSFVSVMQTVTRRLALVGALATVAASLMVIGAAMLFGRRRQALRNLDEDFSRMTTGAASAPAISIEEFTDPWERTVAESYFDARQQLLAQAQGPRSGQVEEPK